MTHYTVSFDILYKINEFLMVKAKVMLLLIKSISKKEFLYIDAFDKKDLANINKAAKMPDKNIECKTYNP